MQGEQVKDSFACFRKLEEEGLFKMTGFGVFVGFSLFVFVLCLQIKQAVWASALQIRETQVGESIQQPNAEVVWASVLTLNLVSGKAALSPALS